MGDGGWERRRYSVATGGFARAGVCVGVFGLDFGCEGGEGEEEGGEAEEVWELHSGCVRDLSGEE